MPFWLGDVHRYLVRVLKNMSCIDLRRFYGQSGSVSSKRYPHIKQCQVPFEPGISAVSDQLVGGLETP